MSDKYVRLKDGTNYIYPELYGIDVNNVLASNVSYPYTAIQDCYVIIQNDYDEYSSLTTSLDGTPLISGAAYQRLQLFLKKGQTISSTSYSGQVIKYVFGLKYHS